MDLPDYAPLAETTCILKIYPKQTISDRVLFSNQVEDDEPDTRYDEPDTRYRVLYVDLSTWHDLGRPETLTITIKPGDWLNNAEAQDA